MRAPGRQLVIVFITLSMPNGKVEEPSAGGRSRAEQIGHHESVRRARWPSRTDKPVARGR